jgi:hypothetical protein
VQRLALNSLGVFSSFISLRTKTDPVFCGECLTKDRGQKRNNSKNKCVYVCMYACLYIILFLYLSRPTSL